MCVVLRRLHLQSPPVHVHVSGLLIHLRPRNLSHHVRGLEHDCKEEGANEAVRSSISQHLREVNMKRKDVLGNKERSQDSAHWLTK